MTKRAATAKEWGLKPIEELPNDGVRVLLMRRTGNDTVKTSVGYRSAFGVIQEWFGLRPPTHFTVLPPFSSRRKAASGRNRS